MAKRRRVVDLGILDNTLVTLLSRRFGGYTRTSTTPHAPLASQDTHGAERDMPPLQESFFARDTVTVARELIGTTMTVGRCRCRIVETEAYTTDAASHAVTRRHKAAIMRDTFAHLYVYKIYCVHYCLNFTTESEGVGAVLIRAAEPLAGIKTMAERRGTCELRMLLNGPARLCQALGIDVSWNALPLGREIKLMAAEHAPPIVAGRRIGITQATHLEWRFCLQGSPFLSRPALKAADERLG